MNFKFYVKVIQMKNPVQFFYTTLIARSHFQEERNQLQVIQ